MLLSPSLTTDLRRATAQAHAISLQAARSALERLAIAEQQPGGAAGMATRGLVKRLLALARRLGDDPGSRTRNLGGGRLVEATAYSLWRKRFYARALAERNALFDPVSGDLADLRELRSAGADRAIDWPGLTALFAYPTERAAVSDPSPTAEVDIPAEFRSDLDAVLDSVPSAVFAADDFDEQFERAWDQAGHGATRGQ